MSAIELKPQSTTDYNIQIISLPAEHPKHYFDLIRNAITSSLNLKSILL